MHEHLQKVQMKKKRIRHEKKVEKKIKYYNKQMLENQLALTPLLAEFLIREEAAQEKKESLEKVLQKTNKNFEKIHHNSIRRVRRSAASLTQYPDIQGSTNS